MKTFAAVATRVAFDMRAVANTRAEPNQEIQNFSLYKPWPNKSSRHIIHIKV